MNEKQEEFILYCLIQALSLFNPRKKEDVEGYVKSTYKKLGDAE